MISAVRPADNPFASHRMDALPYLGLTECRTDLERRIDALGGRVAVVGPKGSGKTTLLEQLEYELPGKVKWIRIPGSDPHPLRTVLRQLDRPVTESDTLFVDGSEQLGALAWRRFLHATLRARRMIVTLHRPGRLPTLMTCATNPGLLRELVSLLAPHDESDLDALFRRHDGNIRSCFRELYDVYAGRRI